VNFQEEALPFLGSYKTEPEIETYAAIVAQHLTEGTCF
jgi:hypothetical protein